MSANRALPLELPPTLSVLEAVTLADVEHRARYQPGDGKTWCNIFVWDVTRALLGDEEAIPHWVGSGGAPCAPFKGRELTANGMCMWLADVGPQYGWHRAGMSEAMAASRDEVLAVAAWENPGGHGHIAVVVPHPGGLMIAQAGKRCFSRGTLAQGFGGRVPTFYVHDLPV